MSYTYDTVFTNYAFNKLAVNLANDNSVTYEYSPYNLIKVKIGNGDHTIDLDKTTLSKSLYELNITNVTVNSSSLVFTCEIPADMKGFEITEIGLFDITTSSEKLFSYSKIQLTKPEDLGYELIIEVNLTLKTIHFYPNLVEIEVIQYERATQDMIGALINTFLYIESNLERIVNFTTDEIGKDKAQAVYERQKTINEGILNFIYVDKYFKLYNKFSSNLKNSFFITYQDLLTYSINDIATDTAYLGISGNKLISHGDSIFFNVPSTLSVTAKLGMFSGITPLLNKIEGQDTYFDFYIDDSIIFFKVYGTNGSCYILSYTFSDTELKYIKDNYVNYTIAFNGNAWSPSGKLYIDGKEKVIDQVSGNLLAISNDSSYLMKNYYASDSSLDNENLDVQSIIFTTKYVTDTEAYMLYMSQKIRNES